MNRREFFGGVVAILAVKQVPQVGGSHAWKNYTFTYDMPLSKAELQDRMRRALRGFVFEPPLKQSKGRSFQ